VTYRVHQRATRTKITPSCVVVGLDLAISGTWMRCI
jgi:hypothetical protein